MTAISKLSPAEKQEILARCLDLHGLTAEDRARLAPRFEELAVERGAVICEEDLEEEGECPTGDHDLHRSTGLYCIVEGLISVTHRPEDRRAPVIFTLGSGGLFGESSLVGGGLLGAEAYRRSRLLRLDREGIRWAREHLPSFRVVVRRLARIYRNLPWLVDRLRRSLLLRNVPPRFVYELLEGADIQDLEPRTVLVSAGQAPGGIYVVLDGELHMCDRTSGHSIRVLGRGDVLGDLEFMASRPLEYEVKASSDERARVLKIDNERLYELIARSSTFRRFLLSCSDEEVAQRESLLMFVHEREQGAINLISVLGDHPSLPMATLVDWLAQSMASDFGDKVVVVHLDRRASESPEIRGEETAEGGQVLRIRLHPRSRTLESGLLDGYGLEAHYVLIDNSMSGQSELPGPLRDVNQTVYLASRPYVELPTDLVNQLPRPLLYTAVVPSPPMPPGMDPIVPIGTVRVHRDLVEAGRRGGGYAELDERLRRQVGRWARAISDRRVGLALGGGGAFGFAHIPLIEQVEKAGIPIDLVSGCSVGAGVGAYYAVRGLDGLGLFLQNAGKILFTSGLISSRAIARYVDSVMGDVRLEDLEVPFLPVVADIDTACQTTIRYGTVGEGVRASASFPGFFTPTIMNQRQPGHNRRLFRFVDGGVINIVPDDTLYLEGAQVALASNVIPPPRSRRRTSTDWVLRVQAGLERVPGKVGAVLREIEPIVRIDDCLRTMYIMMHAPVDWESRTADVKFRAEPGNYSPMQWGKGEAIAQAQYGERLERAVARLQASYRAMRWRRAVTSGSEIESMSTEALAE